MKAQNKLLEFLVALRILDNDLTVSFTSAYLYIGAFICVTQPATVHVVALLTLIFANTNLKRYSRHQSQKLQDSTNQKLMEQQDAEAKVHESNSNELAQLKAQVATLTQITNLRGNK